MLHCSPPLYLTSTKLCSRGLAAGVAGAVGCWARRLHASLSPVWGIEGHIWAYLEADTGVKLAPGGSE